MTLTFRFVAPLLLTAALDPQPPLLKLPRGSAGPGGRATLDLSFVSAPDEPVAALQWTFQFSPNTIAGIAVEDGPAVSAIGKTVICGGGVAAYKCVAVGANTDTIRDGTVARLIITLVPAAKQVDIYVADTLGASPKGQPVIVRGENGKVVIPDAALPRSGPARSKPVSK